MQITYIGHSGFLVEFRNCYCIFDYYKGTLPTLEPRKPILVFSSHAHGDHYNPKIFELLKEQEMARVIAILSKDIPERRWPDMALLNPGTLEFQKVTFYQTYELPCGVTVQTLHSTDRGVAYIVRCDNCVIFHAGDLNDWSFDETFANYSEQKNKQMTGSYRHEIDLLCKLLEGTSLDAAFLPLDPRQGKCYSKGMLYFLEKIDVKKVYPMHYWDKPEIVEQFLKEHPEYKDLF